MLAIGRAFADRGHQVVFATFPAFRYVVEEADLDFFSLPPHWESDILRETMRRLQSLSSPVKQLKFLYAQMAPHLPALLEALYPLILKADLILSSYLFPLHKLLPEIPPKPYAVVAFAHHTMPRDSAPPEGCPRLSFLPAPLQSAYNRFLWTSANRFMDNTLTKVLRQNGAGESMTMKDFFARPAQKVLIAVSPEICPPPDQDKDIFAVTGYCRWQEPANPYLEKELQHFTGSAKVPVLTLGSMVYDDPEATIRQFLGHWPSHRKILIQTGWAGFQLSSPPANAKFIPSCSHDQLFHHADVIIHHGGAGTTASALHAGKPQIIIPHIADQPFFAREMQRLGVGRRLPRKDWIKGLPDLYREVRDDAEMRQKAESLAKKLRQENGPARVVDILSRMALEFDPHEMTVSSSGDTGKGNA